MFILCLSMYFAQGCCSEEQEYEYIPEATKAEEYEYIAEGKKATVEKKGDKTEKEEDKTEKKEGEAGKEEDEAGKEEAKNEEGRSKRQEVKLYLEDYRIWADASILKMHVGGLIDVDADYFTNTDEGHSTFVLRRARIYLEGTIYEMFYYLITGRWDFWTPRVHDTYIDTLFPTWAQLRIGYTKTPFGLENLYRDYLWEFTEKSLGTNIFLFRDTGIQVFGKLWNDALEYHLGIYNGRFALADNNESKDVVGRIVLQPFRESCFFYGGLDNLYFGFSGLIGTQTENLSGTEFITGSGNVNGAGIPFYIFGGNAVAPILVDSQKVMWGADLEWLYGPYAIRAEYLNVDWGNITRTLRNVTKKTPFTANSWYVEFTYNLTGEIEPRNAILVPFSIFTLCDGIGAWQFVARYEELHINPKTIYSGFATGANDVAGPTIGINWILNPYVLTRLDYQYLTFNRRVPVSNHFIHHESLITARLQTSF